MNRIAVAGFIPALFFACLSWSFAQEKTPESKPTVPDMFCHEFNTQIPTKFDGKTLNLKTADGAEFVVYASGDVKSKAQIILIHEWWGLNNHIKGLADQLAKIGYRTYAVDLYDRMFTANREAAAQLMKLALEKPDACLAKLKATVVHAVSENKEARRGTVGWCFGGGWSLQTAIAGGKDVHACVVYYGQLESDVAKLKGLEAPVLGIFADKDTWITPQMAKDFKVLMDEQKKSVTIEIYDADHAFANPSQTRFHEPSAKDAWKKTLEFFKKQLLN